ncbi:hypothetical protein L1O48_01975 [Ligilactobacillus equi]|uniref:hypothetical protein n=1 Tax=Ligilactobacillus equi TaxID=137357 RepID=UPI00046A2979|nr:hypothetical protein [Ligilactobacillus equi]
MQNNKIIAFTLIESVLVLVISTIVLTLGVIWGPACLQAVQERNFWITFDRQWRMVMIEANRYDEQVKIDFSHISNHSRVIFTFEKSNKVTKLDYPPQLQNARNVEAVYRKGGGLKMQKVMIKNMRTKQVYTLVPQIGVGGKYVIQKQ